jgi:hypothetical protein
LNQYELLTTRLNDQNYEATLLICVLHSLLTICSELVKATRKHHKKLLSAPVYDVPQLFGVSLRFVRKYTFPCELTYERFIDHMRNAVSHPSFSDKEPFYPSTGYTTIPDGSGIISRFLFVDSPWVRRGEIHHQACSTKREKVREELKRFEQKYGEIGLTATQNAKGRYSILKDDNIYIPTFEVELTIQSLRSLAKAYVRRSGGSTYCE